MRFVPNRTRAFNQRLQGKRKPLLGRGNLLPFVNFKPAPAVLISDKDGERRVGLQRGLLRDTPLLWKAQLAFVGHRRVGAL
jgi:hypothetical protein